jgi:alginate O-acetyltransferase complex protein AlgI
LSFCDALVGAAAYSLQLYFDFSGYSNMAIGLGRMFGFRLQLNFNSPYQSVSMIDFWRRWHMTLSSFFRNYVYIPLGGNKKGAKEQIFLLWLYFASLGYGMVPAGRLLLGV